MKNAPAALCIGMLILLVALVYSYTPTTEGLKACGGRPYTVCPSGATCDGKYCYKIQSCTYKPCKYNSECSSPEYCKSGACRVDGGCPYNKYI